MFEEVVEVSLDFFTLVPFLADGGDHTVKGITVVLLVLVEVWVVVFVNEGVSKVY